MPILPRINDDLNEPADTSLLDDKGLARGMFIDPNDARGLTTKKYTIFLVEDDNSDRDMILKTLENSPYIHNVHWFDTGDHLLEHFQRSGYASTKLSGPTLILLDISLPGTDGMQVLRKLKENPNTANIPVGMMTGHASDKKVADAFQYRADAYIDKPVQLSRVHEILLTGWSWPGAKK